MNNPNNSPNNYPFATKSQVKARILTDTAFVLGCLGVLYDRQTESEQEHRNTVCRNHAGFSSSHAVLGCTLATKARSEGLTAEEITQAQRLVGSYSKQIAAYLRAHDMEHNPDLKEKAAVFFTPQS